MRKDAAAYGVRMDRAARQHTHLPNRLPTLKGSQHKQTQKRDAAVALATSENPGNRRPRNTHQHSHPAQHSRTECSRAECSRAVTARSVTAGPDAAVPDATAYASGSSRSAITLRYQAKLSLGTRRQSWS